MSRYIDADLIFEYGVEEWLGCVLCGRASKQHPSCDGACDINARRYAKAAIEALPCWIADVPTAEVVEVVRCKDCKYDNHCMTQSFVAENGCIPLDKSTFFCSDAVFERKNKNEI